MGAGYHGGFGGTNGAQEHSLDQSEALIAELENNGIKFTKENIVWITRDRTGQIGWLEKGNSSAGLEHILNGDGASTGHASDFKNAFGISKEEIPSFLHKVISQGTVISNEYRFVNGHMGYDRIYYYEGNHYVLTGIGSNGFIVTAYPIDY